MLYIRNLGFKELSKWPKSAKRIKSKASIPVCIGRRVPRSKQPVQKFRLSSASQKFFRLSISANIEAPKNPPAPKYLQTFSKDASPTPVNQHISHSQYLASSQSSVSHPVPSINVLASAAMKKGASMLTCWWTTWDSLYWVSSWSHSRHFWRCYRGLGCHGEVGTLAVVLSQRCLLSPGF